LGTDFLGFIGERFKRLRGADCLEGRFEDSRDCVGYNEFASLKDLLSQSFHLARSDIDRKFAGGVMG
jgi:hypothetical protein